MLKTTLNVINSNATEWIAMEIMAEEAAEVKAVVIQTIPTMVMAMVWIMLKEGAKRSRFWCPPPNVA